MARPHFLLLTRALASGGRTKGTVVQREPHAAHAQDSPPTPGLPDTTLSPPRNRASTPSRGQEQSWHHPPIPQWYRLRLGAKSAAGHAANHCVPACSGHRPRPQPAAKQPRDPGWAIQGFDSASLRARAGCAGSFLLTQPRTHCALRSSLATGPLAQLATRARLARVRAL